MRATPILNSLSLISACFLAIFVFTAKADTLSGAGGSWQSWNQSQLVINGTTPGGTLGTPYWNNYSGDGPKGNIGWCLTGGGTTCMMSASPASTLPYFGTNTGGSVSNMYFTSNGTPLGLSLTLLGINTNETNSDFYDVFGYYLLSSPTTLHPLFSSLGLSKGPVYGDNARLNLPSGTQYGFYIENIKGAPTNSPSNYIFYMDSALDQDLSLGPDGLQHFAIFQNGSSYVIGDVDGVGCDPTKNLACVNPIDFDFNDLIVTETAIPEPSTFGLIGLSALLLAGLLRRNVTP
jgi:hypothetical protein